MEHEHAPESPPGRILTVCSGNICRSPAAELLLRSALGRAGRAGGDGGGEWSISSAGTIGVVGHPVQREMAELLAATQAVPRELIEGFSARRLTPAVLERADLVLAMAAEHRSAAVHLDPRAFRRTFTLREFSALMAGLPASVTGPAYPSAGDRLRAVVSAADELRRGRALHLPRDLDIADPYGRGQAAYEQAYAAITAAAEPIVAALTGSLPQTGRATTSNS